MAGVALQYSSMFNTIDGHHLHSNIMLFSLLFLNLLEPRRLEPPWLNQCYSESLYFTNLSSECTLYIAAVITFCTLSVLSAYLRNFELMIQDCFFSMYHLIQHICIIPGYDISCIVLWFILCLVHILLELQCIAVCNKQRSWTVPVLFPFSSRNFFAVCFAHDFFLSVTFVWNTSEQKSLIPLIYFLQYAMPCITISHENFCNLSAASD